MYLSSRGKERPLALLKWLLMRRWESPAIETFDSAIVVSPDDLQNLRAIGCRLPAVVVGNGVDTRKLTPLEASPGEDLVFVGTMAYYPNREAVRWFAREILPLIRAEKPACCFYAVGSGGRKHLADLHQPGVIEVTDSVDDLVACYRKSALAVAPLLSGGGTRLKILEAMALGRPVVSTPLGCEGLDVQDGVDLCIAESAKAFARKVIELLDDRARCRELSRAARSRVESTYDWNLLAEQLQQEYVRIGGNAAA